MFMDNKFYNCLTFLCICVYDCVCGYICMYLCLVWRLKVYLGVSSVQLSRCILICASVGCVHVCGCLWLDVGSLAELLFTTYIEVREPRAHLLSWSGLLINRISGGTPHPPRVTWVLES